MFNDPIRQSPLETDIAARFFGFNPFVPQNLFAFGLELPIQRRILQQIVGLRWLFGIVGHIADKNVLVE